MIEGRLLRAKRAEHEISQEALAEKLGITNRTYSRKESGYAYFTAREIQCLKRLLKLSASDIDSIFFGGEESV